MSEKPLLFYNLTFDPRDLRGIKERAHYFYVNKPNSTTESAWVEAVLEALYQQNALKLNESTHYANGEQKELK